VSRIAAQGANLQAQVEEIRSSSGDQVRLDDVANVVHSLMTTIEGDISAADLRAHRELESLLDYVKRAREEIASLRPSTSVDVKITAATDELDAVVAATEDATSTFLDAAERIEVISDEVDSALAARLSEIATDIYEASNFQDITGQRITKVVRALSQIEERVERVAKVLNGEEVPDLAPEEDPLGDEELLNGPAIPDAANSQDDIDALLASFD